MGERDREAHGIMGSKGKGKSPYIMKLMDDCYDLRKARILIISPSQPAAFANLPIVQSISVLGQRAWRGIFLYVINKHAKDFLIELNELSRNGVLKGGAVVLDDCDEYITSSLPDGARRPLISHKNNGWDLFLVSHGLIDFPAFARRNVSSYTLFQTLDEFTSVNDLIGFRYPNATALYYAWQELKKAKRVNGYIQPHITIKTGL